MPSGSRGSTDAGERRRALLGVKLAALVDDHAGRGASSTSRAELSATFGGGAGAVVDGTAWVLLDDRPAERLGAAIVWGLRQGARAWHLLAESGTGQLQRRAEGFEQIITVSHVEGRELLPAVAEPLPVAPPARAEHLAFEPLIVAVGAHPIVEFGVVMGEVRGLEVCRVVDDPDTGAVRLEVGVGAHDREVFQLLHGDLPTEEALANIVRHVAPHRALGAAPHPLNHLAASRARRAELLADPALVGASSVVAVPPPLPRANVKDERPCVAEAIVDGERVAVVCTSGIDLDVVPFALDAIASRGVGRALVAAVARDIIDIQQRIAASARCDVRFVGVAPAGS